MGHVKPFQATLRLPLAHLKRELVHEVDLVRVGDVAVLEVLDRHGESCAKEADLPLPLAVVHQLLQHGLELGREELISLKNTTKTNESVNKIRGKKGRVKKQKKKKRRT